MRTSRRCVIPTDIIFPIFFFSKEDVAIYCEKSDLEQAWIFFVDIKGPIEVIYDGRFRQLRYIERRVNKPFLGLIPYFIDEVIFSLESHKQDEPMVRKKLFSYLKSRIEPIVDSNVVGAKNLGEDSAFDEILKRSLDYARVYK